jgi:hypothetical protein
MTEIKKPFENKLLELGLRVGLPFKIVGNKIYIEIPKEKSK